MAAWNPLRSVWASYTRLLQRRPLVAQAILMASGDLIAQKVLERKDRIDFNRNKNFWIVGGCFVGPVLGKWLAFIDRRFTGPPRIKILKMLLADQLLMAPPLVFAIVSSLILLGGLSVEQWKTQMSQTYPGIMLNNYKLWPAAQLINFLVIPLPYRVLYMNIVILFWNVYIAYAMQSTQRETN